MSYNVIVDNACRILANVGVAFHVDDAPTILAEEELCDNFRVYVGEWEAEELQRQLIIADIGGNNA